MWYIILKDPQVTYGDKAGPIQQISNGSWHPKPAMWWVTEGPLLGRTRQIHPHPQGRDSQELGSMNPCVPRSHLCVVIKICGSLHSVWVDMGVPGLSSQNTSWVGPWGVSKLFAGHIHPLHYSPTENLPKLQKAPYNWVWCGSMKSQSLQEGRLKAGE